LKTVTSFYIAVHELVTETKVLNCTSNCRRYRQRSAAIFHSQFNICVRAFQSGLTKR